MVINSGGAVRVNRNLALGLDFGGTKLAAAVVDLSSGKLASPVIRRRTPVSEGAAGTLREMIVCGKEAVSSSCRAAEVARVGISFGGPVSMDRKRVLHSNHVADWDDAPLVETISGAFQLPAVMDNDANAAALGVWQLGGFSNDDHLVYVQISTGVGCGLILDHRLYRGSALAGELGHFIVQPDGPMCLCGRKGCLESLCSGWAFARDAREAFTNNPDACPVLVPLCHHQADQINARLVFEACRQGDAACVAIVQNAFNSLGMALANVISMLDPQVVVLGGGITRSKDMIYKYLVPSLQQQMHPFFTNRSRLELSGLDGCEPLFGAALLTRELDETG
jgi:glucokinase